MHGKRDNNLKSRKRSFHKRIILDFFEGMEDLSDININPEEDSDFEEKMEDFEYEEDMEDLDDRANEYQLLFTEEWE